MVKQIVQTAVAVAPKMSPVIIDCANKASPGAVEVSDEKAQTVQAPSGKNAKNVLPEPVQPPKESGSDYSGGPVSLRGVYLMTPSVGGFVTSTTPDDGDDEDDKPKPPKKHRPRVVTPLSPSCTCPEDQAPSY